MKNFKKSFLAMMILVVALMAMGCGSEDQAKYEGTYEIESFKMGDNEMEASLLDMIKDQIVFELKADGKGKIALPGEEVTKFEWEVDGGEIKITDKDSKSIGKIKGDKIIIKEEGMEMVFKKK